MRTSQTLLAGLLLTTSTILPMTAVAQDKHIKLKTAAAGVAAYELAKHTGKGKAHKNFMQRHPVLTGVAAAAIAHHELKKKPKHH
jgi:hypothetical protein